MAVSGTEGAEREGSASVTLPLRRLVGEVVVEGTVRASASDLVVEIARPWALRLASGHIPWFALPRVRWVEGGTLTAEGKREVEDLLGAAIALARAVEAHRDLLVQEHAAWQREVAPVEQEREAALAHLLAVRREGRQRLRSGALGPREWQHEVLKPARERLARAKAAMWDAERALDARLAALLGFSERLPGGVGGRSVLALAGVVPESGDG